jgi:hypothetical protein
MNSLTKADYEALGRSYLTPEIIDRAQIKRVDTHEGAFTVGKDPTASKDYSGIIFPYTFPGETRPREYRLRRDCPDLEKQPDGSTREKNKYLSPPGRGNILYFSPDTPVEFLTDISIPITITEGEKKTLALSRYYSERKEKRLVIGLPGVWNFRGVVGKTTNAKGQRQDVKGVVSDFDRIKWTGREVLIIFDTNVLTNETVAAARRELSKEVQRRGAIPVWVNLPTGIEGVNGVDDLLAKCGKDFVTWLFVNSVNTVIDLWELPSPFTEYDLPEFPLDALPDWLRSYVKGLSVATQTPMDLAAMLSLANISATLAGKVKVRVREDWEEPTNIYSLTSLDVGNRKTAVHDATKEPLEDFEAQLVHEKQPKIAELQLEQDLLATRLEHLKKEAAREKDPGKRDDLEEDAREVSRQLQEMNIPAVPKLIVSGDITPEAIGTNLYEQGGRLALFSDEGELFQLLAGRYGNGTNIETVNKAHTGSKIRIDRKGKSEIIDSATLVIGMTPQPSVIRGMADVPQFREKGLAARILYSMPKSLVGRRNSKPEPLTDEAKSTYSKRVKKLAELHKVEDGGKFVAREIGLSKDARDYLTQFMEEIEPQLGEGGKLRPIADWANKLAGEVVRLSAILHYAEKSDSDLDTISEIPSKAIKDAIKIGRYLIPHTQAAYAEMGADPQIEGARKLLRWITEAKSAAESTFTKRDIHRANAGTFRKVTDLEPALELLEAHGFIRTVESVSITGKVGRKASQVYEVNPVVWSREFQNPTLNDTIDSIDTIPKVEEVPLTDDLSSVNSVNTVIGVEISNPDPEDYVTVEEYFSEVIENEASYTDNSLEETPIGDISETAGVSLDGEGDLEEGSPDLMTSLNGGQEVQVQNGTPDPDDDLTQAREIVKKLNRHQWPNDSYRPKIREYMAAVENGSVSPDLLKQMRAFAVGRGVIGH